MLAFASFELGMLAAFVRTQRGHYEALHSPQVRLRCPMPTSPTHPSHTHSRHPATSEKQVFPRHGQGGGAHRYLSESCVAEHCVAAAADRADGDEVRRKFAPLDTPGCMLGLSLPPSC